MNLMTNASEALGKQEGVISVALAQVSPGPVAAGTPRVPQNDQAYSHDTALQGAGRTATQALIRKPYRINAIITLLRNVVRADSGVPRRRAQAGLLRREVF